MSTPKVSVIVPIYNTEKELPRCIQSIREQTFSDIEIILVDDGSTGSCPQMCDTFANQDPRIRVIHKENRGAAAARNTGLLDAKGEYILYVDSDDYIEKDAIEQMLRGALPGVDLIAGAYSDWNGKKLTIRRRTGLEDSKIYTPQSFIINSIKKDQFLMVIPWSYMYRRNYLIENNLFFREGLIHEDLDLILDLLLHTDSIIYIDYPFYTHVFRDGSVSFSENSLKKVRDNVIVTEHWKETVESIENTTLQKYLYFELISNYLWMCKYRDLIGWGFSGITFPYAFIHAFGLKQKVKVMLFELKTIYYKLTPPRPEAKRLLTLKEYNKLIMTDKNSAKERETINE